MEVIDSYLVLCHQVQIFAVIIYDFVEIIVMGQRNKQHLFACKTMISYYCSPTGLVGRLLPL